MSDTPKPLATPTSQPPGVREKARVNFVRPPGFFDLHLACGTLARAYGCNLYHVGSSLERRDYGDVDIRCILDDAEYDKLFPASRGGEGVYVDARWNLLNAALSAWLTKQSGLPVDFQFQRQTQANEAERGGLRSAIGIFLSPPETP